MACATAPEAAAPITRDSLRALRWIAPDVDVVKALTTAPTACEQPLNEIHRNERLKRSLGRVAFESPALIGGAAARMGLSCSSCHINGRGNPAFFVEGISGGSGTADVSSSFFSKVRGNGTSDPVPIPDLAARDGTQIKDRRSAAFRTKIHGLIVEEFDGQEPPPFVFDALLAYLDSLDIAHCADPSAVADLDFPDDFSAVMTASTVLGADVAADVKLFYVRAARERLERLHERYPLNGKAAKSLEALSLSFAEQAAAIREGRPETDLTDELIALAELLIEEGDRSLYNPEVLGRALDRMAETR